jgi:hypothetical protein
MNRLFKILSSIDSDQAIWRLAFPSFEVRALRKNPPWPEVVDGVSGAVKKGRTIAHVNEKTAWRNIALLPARVAGSASCGDVAVGIVFTTSELAS